MDIKQLNEELKKLNEIWIDADEVDNKFIQEYQDVCKIFQQKELKEEDIDKFVTDYIKEKYNPLSFANGLVDIWYDGHIFERGYGREEIFTMMQEDVIEEMKDFLKNAIEEGFHDEIASE
jgi:hypothetical protein